MEKRSLPLASYHVGPSFFASWQSIEGIDRQKVVGVIVEILTGRVHQLTGRETHHLRASDGGGAAFVARPDGPTCWRVALRQHPSGEAPALLAARGWEVELSSVRHHDDFHP